MRTHLIRLFAIVVLLVALLPLAAGAAPPDPPKTPAGALPKIDPAVLQKIEPLVFKELAEKGTTTYLVHLQTQADAQLAAAGKPDKLARRQAVVTALQETARRTQAAIISYLESQRRAGNVASFTSYWIFNGLAVTGDEATLLALAARPEVARIRANHVRHMGDAEIERRGDAETYAIAESVDLGDEDAGMDDFSASPRPGVSTSPTAVEWNVSKIRADQVWAALGITGQGIVVANIDTGVYYQHPALLQKYRGYSASGVDHNYNWFDPTNSYPSAPNDGHGHGTHTMGTMVGAEPNGTNNIGVAPGAKWIAVKGFDDEGNATDAGLHAAFQWVMAPTNLQGQNPDPAKAADIVSNSWGDENSSDTTFWNDVLNLRAAGIMPVFAGGNSGPDPGTVDSPGSLPQSFAVGATNANDVVATFSGRGPSPWNEIKPEVVAPGVGVRSSYPPSVEPGMYGLLSGTSMATPHGAATTALLWQANSNLTVTATEYLLTSTAFPLPSQAQSPNNDYGWGRLDAYQAVSALVNSGTLWGRVTDALSGQPLSGASIRLMRQDNGSAVQTTSNGSGYYTVTVAVGIYDVTASEFWHETQTVQDVSIAAGYTTIVDFALLARPTGILRGQVREEGTATPLTATISLNGLPAVFATDASGVYSASVPVGTYSVRARPAVGHRQSLATGVGVTARSTTVQDFDLVPAPTILVVDADYYVPASRVEFYQADLDDLLLTYDLWRVTSVSSDIPSASVLGRYDIVIWHQPLASPGYMGAWSSLGAFLDAGGRLLISGQDIGYWDDSQARDRLSYNRYLHASYVQDDPGVRTLSGIAGDVFTGITLTLNTSDSAGNQSYPDVITPTDSAATVVISYTGVFTGAPAGLKIETPSYRAIYLAFGLEGAGPRPARRETLNRALTWLSLPAFSKSVDKEAATWLDVVTYTLRLQNPSSRTISGMNVIDPIPSGVTYIENSATGGLAFSPLHNQLEWHGSVAPGAILTFTFQARLNVGVGGGSVVENVAYLDDGHGVAVPARASTLVVAPDLSTSRKAAAPTSVIGGQEITYTIFLTNTGIAAAPHVTLTDPIPAGTTYVEGSVTFGASYNAGTNSIEWYGSLGAAQPSADYSFKTSDQPGGPQFNWVDITATGTRVSAGDDTISGPFNIGFLFPFYDARYTAFYINSNGALSFLQPGSALFSNVCLPAPSVLPLTLALWWDDLYPGAATDGGVYYWSNGSDTLIVSFVNVPRYSSGGPYSFQAILRADGTITYQYLSMQGTRLDEATIGIQDPTGTKGFSVACNQPFVHDQLAILITPPLPPSVGHSLSFRVRVDEGLPVQSVVTNTAFINSDRGLTYTVSAATPVNVVDVSATTKAVDKAVAAFGDTLHYTITVRNTGNITGSIMVTDVLPAQVSYVPGSASGGAAYDEEGRRIGWQGDVGPGLSASLSFAATVGPGLPDNSFITNTAMIVGPRAVPSLVSATTLHRAPDLSASSKRVTPGTVRSGGVVTFTITVANAGGVATSFLVTDTLPLALAYLPGTLETGHGSAVYDATAGRILWNGTLPALHQSYLRFAAQVAGTGTITNTATIQDAAGRVVERSTGVTVTSFRFFLPVILVSNDWPGAQE